MTTSSHLGEHLSFAGSPPAVAAGLAVPPNTRGLRRQTLETFAVQGEAEGFSGLSEDIPHYRRVHDVAAKALRLQGVSEPALALLGYLFNWTQPQDWLAGSRPVVFPSNDTVCADHGLTEASLRRHVMELRHAGAIAMKDSGNNKRHGRRDPEGRIMLSCTFGYDLSPLALRQAHYQDIVKAHKADCALRKDARRTAKIASRALQQLIESAEAWKLLSPYWEALPQRLADLREQMEQAASTAALADVAHRLEQLRKEALAVFNAASAERAKGGKSHAPETCGTNGENAATSENNKWDLSGRPLKSERHYNTTTKTLDSDSVQAQRTSVAGFTPCVSQAPAEPVPDLQTSAEATKAEASNPDDPRKRNCEAWRDRAPWDGGTLNMPQVKTSAAELASVVPELQKRLGGAEANWGSLSSALRSWAHEAGISVASIKHAEKLMGWQSAFIGLAVVASKDGYHFDVSPGAYFNGGIVKRAQNGTLDLRATLWGLREGTTGAPVKPAPVPMATHDRVASPAEAARKTAGSDRDEERAEIAMAKAVKRTGPGQQSLAQAVTGAVLPREIKRGVNAAMAPADKSIAKPALPMASVSSPGAGEDPLMAQIKASWEQHKAEDAQRLAAMTPAQRALHDQREAQRLAICSSYRRQPNRA